MYDVRAIILDVRVSISVEVPPSESRDSKSLHGGSLINVQMELLV